jgi:hypothetical protein
MYTSASGMLPRIKKQDTLSITWTDDISLHEKPLRSVRRDGAFVKVKNKGGCAKRLFAVFRRVLPTTKSRV